MISIMTPSRGRVPILTRMIQSARDTATGIEFIIFADDDDTDTQAAVLSLGAKLAVGPRSIIHSARWDKCLPQATGDLYLSANDDIVFRTPGWDLMVEDWFSKSEDKIWMVHGDDLAFGRDKTAAHPIVHRRWVETLGYFFPPYFDGDYPDEWVCTLANKIGRRKFLPFVCEHMHFMVGKGEQDTTDMERRVRERQQDPGALYHSPAMAAQRNEDTEKLRIAMETQWR